MLYSMTGFGKSEATINNTFIQVEIRTLNSKGFDLNVRMPSIVRHKEVAIRNLLSEQLRRGKIDVFVTIDLPADQQAGIINQDVISYYLDQLQQVAEEFSLDKSTVLESVLKLPNVISQSEDNVSEDTWQKMEVIFYEACERVNAFREKEGNELAVELTQSISTIQHNLEEIPSFEAERIHTIRQRIISHIEQYINRADIDENRLEQELVFYIEKYDISEEKVRLAAHLNHFMELLQQPETMAKGKKLNFVSQEIGREINTIGSKANHVEIQRRVVEMKDQLEQIKEQLLNTV